jgi:hypothetical protein
MKLSFSLSLQKQCFFLGISIVIILAVFYWYKKHRVIEGLFFDDTNEILLYNRIKDKVVDINNEISSTIRENAEEMKNNIKSAITGKDYNNNENNNQPQWNDRTGQEMIKASDTVTVARRANVSVITADGCNKNSLLKSDYKKDICAENLGDYKTINEKCNALSNTNCNYISCCVLLNGNKCVAGDVNGPTYLTDQGNEIDYDYYKYRGKIYPEGYNFQQSSTYLKNCGKYASNSTNVSEACMLQLFHDAGCPNKNPAALINNKSVYKYSKSSKEYIKKDMENAVKLLKGKMQKDDDDSRILCNGADPTNPCDVFNNSSLGVSRACMLRMFNDAGCPNKKPSIINEEFVLNYSTLPKKNLKSAINVMTKGHKNVADTGDDGSDAQLKSYSICYGSN